MLEKIKRTLREAGEAVKEQASILGEGAKEKSYQLIEEWLKIFPKLEKYGLKITSFALSIALSPALEVELKGSHQDFSAERLRDILKDCAGNTALLSVLNTVKMTYDFHRKIYAELREPLIVKIRIKITPEIKVFIGEPIIQ